MTAKITLRIILEKPNTGVCFGVQYGAGNTYETHQKQVAAGSDLVFDMELPLKNGKDGTIQLAGKYVQGPAGAKFIYIDIGTYAGQPDAEWGRRLKIPLTGMDQLLANLSGDRTILETKVPGKGKDGGPNCATVKPFAGWKQVPE